MLNKRIEAELNKQVNAEMYSAYLYLSMAAYCGSNNLQGFANWMKVQFEEEQAHALKIYDYIQERGGRVNLDPIEAPKSEWENIVNVFEEVLAQDIRLAFFIPLVVYMAAAVGAQTQSIYTRDLRTGRASFKKYFLKESAIGLFFGISAGLVAFLITSLWFDSTHLAQVVSLAMFGAVTIAPLVAIFVTAFLQLEHKDPAVGAGPIATVIQDTLSVLIYGLVATSIVLY